VYVERLAGKVVSAAIQPPAFFANYQLLRNVSHLRDQDALVLLVPRANAGAFGQAAAFIENAVDLAWRPRVRLIALEDLIERILALSPNAETVQVLELLREKYVVAHPVLQTL